MNVHKSEFVMHRPASFDIAGVNNYWAVRTCFREKTRDIKTCSWVARNARYRIKIVVEGNKLTCFQKWAALCNHEWCFTPNVNFKIFCQFLNSEEKLCNALLFVFQNENAGVRNHCRFIFRLRLLLSKHNVEVGNV